MKALKEAVLPECIRIINENTLPLQFPLYESDRIPTNQRNLTDVRTRMGVHLEYEIAKAINEVLGDSVTKEVMLTYVIGNKFPDLAFRTRSGRIGVRFEVKAIQTIAEETAANFDTLIKEIRKGTDFVVVIVWDWVEHQTLPLKCPYIENIFVLDAYHLAQMRDCYWLNRPPANVGNARQGFDLCFGVNCRAGNYNKEEGNYGKLMRIFSPEYEKYLPAEVKTGSTLKTFYDFCKTTYAHGLRRIALSIADAFCQGHDNPAVEIVAGNLPIVIKARRGSGDSDTLLIIGNVGLPTKGDAVPIMVSAGSGSAILLNSKFDWKVRTREWELLGEGNKPAGAIDYAKSI